MLLLAQMLQTMSVILIARVLCNIFGNLYGILQEVVRGYSNYCILYWLLRGDRRNSYFDG